jgi:hypothetical protein
VVGCTSSDVTLHNTHHTSTGQALLSLLLLGTCSNGNSDGEIKYADGHGLPIFVQLVHKVQRAYKTDSMRDVSLK